MREKVDLGKTTAADVAPRGGAAAGAQPGDGVQADGSVIVTLEGRKKRFPSRAKYAEFQAAAKRNGIVVPSI
jgi:hypothetical protein